MQLDPMEERIARLAERIAHFDNLENDVKAFKSVFDEIKALYDGNFSNIGEDILEVKKVGDGLTKLFQYVSEKVSNHESYIKDVQAKVESIIDYFARLQDTLNSHASILSNVEDSLNKTSESTQNAVSKHEVLSSRLSDVGKYLEEKVETLSSSLRPYTQKCNDMNAFMSKVADHESTLSSLTSKMNQIEAQVPFTASNLGTKIEMAVDQLKKEFAKSIDEVKALIPPPPKEDNIGEKIMAELENMRLDVSNASLKASNADMQLGLMQKKIENVQLQLKQMELSK